MTELARDMASASAWATLLMVFAVPALEASTLLGLLVPGEIAVLLGGALAHQGRIPLLAVIAAAVSGAVTGDSIGFAVGARLGPKLWSRAAPARAVRKLTAVHALVDRVGGATVLIGRWAAVLRAVVPAAAGAGRMPYRRFAAWNVLGGTLWGVGIAGMGYLAGAAYGRTERTLGLAGIAVALVVLTAAITVVVHRVLQPTSGRKDRHQVGPSSTKFSSTE